MRGGRKLRLRLRSLFERSRVESELEDELADYLERETEEYVRRGVTPEEAKRLARMSVYGTERLKEECRDARKTRWLEDALTDLRFALRTMRREPAFSATVVAALTLCIGANTAIFSVVDAVLFRPLPFPDQQRLVSLMEGIPGAGFPEIPFSCPDYLFVSAHNRSFTATGSYRTESYEISGTGEPRQEHGARVTASLFSVLQVRPIIGRVFTEDEDNNARPVAVLGYGLAAELFAKPERAIGRTVHLDRKAYTVLGVMPRSFVFPPRGLKFSGDPADLLVPMAWTANDRKELLNNFDSNVIARLRAGASVAQAAADVQSLLRSMAAAYPPDVLKLIATIPHFSLESHVVPFRQEITGDVQRPLLLLLVAVGIVLLIGCADVANLILSRMLGRQREFALRAALGAGEWRLARQTITEGLVLSVCGGVLGMGLAFWALPLLIRFAPDNLPRLNEVSLNWRVGGFVMALSLTTPLFFCLAPLFNIIRLNPSPQLREGSRNSTQGKRQRKIMSSAVVAQFGLAFILLTVAGLLVRSFVRASEANPGFRAEHLLSVHVALPTTVYSNSKQVGSFINRLLLQLSALPGVRETGAVSTLPMEATSNNILSVEGRANRTEKIETVYCSGNTLETLKVVLLRGRVLQADDEFRKQGVAVISESAAKQIWPHEDPLGQHINFGGDGKEPWMTVVGVIKDIKSRLTSDAPRSMMFTTRADWVNEMEILVRTTGDPRLLANAIRHQIHQLDPSLPVGELKTVDEVLSESLSPERFRTWLLALFAVAALILAMLGIAGLLAYNSGQRTQEFGVRLALGANRRHLLFLVFGQGLRLGAMGIAIGFGASIFVNRILSALLYDTSRYDAMTFVSVPLLLLFVALAASVWPAWRVARIDPITSLRAE